MVSLDDKQSTKHPGRQPHGADESTRFWCHVLRCLMPGYMLAEKLAIANLDLPGFARCVAQAWSGTVPVERALRDGSGGAHLMLDPATLRRLVDEVATELAQRPGSRVKS